MAFVAKDNCLGLGTGSSVAAFCLDFRIGALGASEVLMAAGLMVSGVS